MVAFNHENVPLDNTTVKTGDDFAINNLTYHIIIYGDVNSDGLVNSSDALKILEHDAQTNVITDEFCIEAGNVVRDSSTNSTDALKILEYDSWNSGEILDKPLVSAEDKYDYMMYIKEDEYINNSNNVGNGVTILIEPNEGGKMLLDETKTLKMEVRDDEELTILLKDEKNNEVAKLEVERHTAAPKVKKVKTTRISENEATMYFENAGNDNIVKMYYVIYPIIEEDDIIPPTDSGFWAEPITIENNKLNNVIVSRNLEPNKAYQLHYYVENSYGSQSAARYTIVGAENDMEIIQEDPVTSIKVPDFKTTNEFSWTIDEKLDKNNTRNFEVRLYKCLEEGETETIEAKLINRITLENIDSNDKLRVNFYDAFKYEGGGMIPEIGRKYKIGIVVKGNKAVRNTVDSEEMLSDEVEVKSSEKPPYIIDIIP